MNRPLQLWVKVMVGISGLSKRAFAVKYGISIAQVSRVTRFKRNISLELFERIATGQKFTVRWKLVELKDPCQLIV